MNAAFVEIIPLDRIVSRNDIECPGDTIPYNCSIQSNSEAVHLTWHLTLPGDTSISFTYPNGSVNGTNLNSYITTFLTGFESDEFIHSTFELVVQPGIPTDQIMVECSIGDLGNSIIIHINTSGKLSRSFNYYSLFQNICITIIVMIIAWVCSGSQDTYIFMHVTQVSNISIPVDIKYSCM